MVRTRFSVFLHFAAPAALAACALATPAAAQDSAQSNASFWLQERARAEHARPVHRQAPRIRRLVPNKHLARPTVWRRQETRPAENHRPAPAAHAPELATAPAPGQDNASSLIPPPQTAPAPSAPGVGSPASVAPKVSVAVIGDNIAYHLAQGLRNTEEDDGGIGLALSRNTKDSSGLVRDDYYDWQASLREILAGPEKYGAIVIMIGSNDRQDLRDSDGRYEPLTPRWKEIYAARVDALIAQIKAKNIPFYWIGLPIMRSERYSGDIQQINEIYRARVEAAGGKYVDVWDAFADEKGRYNTFGPDVSGQIVKIRTSDGIHFTNAGQRKLAYFVEQAMRSLTERARAEPGAAIAALPAGQQQGQPSPAGLPGSAPLAAPPPPKPEFGPVLPLTAPPLAANGQLLGPPDAKGAEISATIATDLAATPPQGRADDFHWPRRQ
ncbi:MAG: DUF459 domain-containing protein [Rhodoblastus sp.]